MKKVLLFAGMAALMAACSNEELVPNEVAGGVGKAAKGIVFETAPLEETRGELTEDYKFFWYAEQDRINVYASNVEAVTEGSGEGATGNTEGLGVANATFSDNPLKPAVYKATQSAGQGRFTAINDNNWIKFANGHEVAVIATYPAGVTEVTEVNASQKGVKNPDVNVTTEIKGVGFKTRIDVNQTENYNTTKAPMISQYVGHKRNANYENDKMIFRDSPLC